MRLIDCIECGGSGCDECRQDGRQFVQVIRVKGVMPASEEAFLEQREKCPCYMGISINEDVHQCTHADAQAEGEICEPVACPLLSRSAEAAPLES